MTGEKIINFKLNAQTIEKLTKQKSLHVEYKKSGVFELVLNDARIRLDTMKGSTSPKADATYYNNNSSTLHFIGDTILATPTIKKIVEKKHTKESIEQRDKVARRIELLDVPSSTDNSSRSPSTKAAKISANLKKSSSSKKSKSASNNNNYIPTPTTPSSSSKGSNTPQKTFKSSKPFDPLVTKTSLPSEEKYSMKTRILQRLAIQPWSLIEITKSLNRSQLERCEQLEVKHILDMVAIPIKKDERKKFCLKPNLYKDIQIWTWPFYSHADKLTAADNAKEAYDLLQSQGFEIDRSNLSHPESPYKPPAITSPMLANGKKTLSPLNNRKPVAAPQQEKGKGRLTPVDHASPSTPILPSKLASPQKSKPITPTQLSAPTPSPQATASTPSHLKPSSANKKYASSKIFSPQQNGATTTINNNNNNIPEKLSPPTKRKSVMNDDVDVPSRDTLAMPTPRLKKRIKESVASTVSTPTPPPKSVKMSSSSSIAPIPSQPAAATTTSLHKPVHKEPTSIKPLNIKKQHNFSAYCYNYVKQQKDYTRAKRFFIDNFPQYVKVLQSTEPPKGTKRSYYDLNAEYQDMLRANYLKQGDDEKGFKEAQDFLVDCNNKRRRLNYMWTSIKQNIDEYHHTIPKSLCNQ
ncbi:hypothetical protein [Parasitella parasitica]|uniref:RNA polymerase II elongation factor ELL N-terminal domain-containing protein n=1 Tax=Parasitella parasitica TaxID=35722 RepID=A0A0B7NLE8_9FUNG|nr:hypothetical protein [Parasitella parasitica]